MNTGRSLEWKDSGLEGVWSLWFICTHHVRCLAAEIAMVWIHLKTKGPSHQFSQFFEANPQESLVVEQKLENALDSQLKQLEEKELTFSKCPWITVKGQKAALKHEAHCLAHIIITELLNIKKHLVKILFETQHESVTTSIKP